MPIFGGGTTLQANSFAANNFRILGNTAPEASGTWEITDIKVRAHMTTGSGTLRLAVYRGTNVNDPNGATLIWDAGQTSTISGASAVTYTIAGNGSTISGGGVWWLSWKTQNTSLRLHGLGSTFNDWHATNGRFDDTAGAGTDENPAVVWPATWPHIGTEGNTWYNIWITYTASSSVTATRQHYYRRVRS